MRIPRAPLLSASIWLIAALLGAAPVHAASADRPTSFKVNVRSDGKDQSVGNGKCDTSSAAGNQCTLRAAVQEANYWGAGPQINIGLAAGTYTLTIQRGSGADTAAVGDLDLLTSLKFNGTSTQGAVISAGANFDDRLFDVPGNVSPSVLFLGMVIKGGTAPGSESGGGIRWLGKGTLSLSNVTVSGNTAGGSGGGLYMDAGKLGPTVKATFSGNTANLATGNGGGIDFEGSVTTTATTPFSASALNNQAANGGGLSTFAGANPTGFVELDGGLYQGNTATVNGGGMDVSRTFVTHYVTIAGNNATNGGGIRMRPGGTDAPTLVGGRVMIGDNTATIGGGIYANKCGTTCSVVGTTIGYHKPYWSPVDSTGNHAVTAGAAIYVLGTLSVTASSIGKNTISGAGAGGAIYHGGTGVLTLMNDTIADNRGGNANGGVVLASQSTDILTNVTLALNTGTGANALARISGASAPKIKNTILAVPGPLACAGSVTSLGHNLSFEGNDSNSCRLAAGKGDLIGVDPELYTGGLNDNGGGTASLRPRVGSPVIDAGTNAGCLATDQRLVKRPQKVGKAVCDIGAYEVSEYTRNSQIEATISASPARASKGQKVTFTITLVNHGPLTSVNSLVQDILPSSLVFISCSTRPAPSHGAYCGGSGLNRTATFPSLRNKASCTVTIVTKVSSNTTASSIHNSVLETSDNPDTYPVDNSPSVVVHVS